MHLSLCSGYGGLDLALGTQPTWVSEIDPGACAVLEKRFPDAENLGDLTGIDPPQADIVTAGFPCQGASYAGRRKGVNDERWLWDDIETLIGRMGRPPGRVFLENVPGLLTVNGGDAMARIVGGLARLGFVGSYGLLRASDVGACHQRQRWFCVAAHPDSEREPGAEYPVEDEGRPSDGNIRSRPNNALLPTPTTSDANGARPHGDGGPDLRTAVSLLPSRFGEYAPAVEHHATVIGRPAPEPTDGKRLNPAFVEWMMMLPQGWVTDCDLSHTATLRVLGNGVVPAQAATAYDMLRPCR